MGPLTFLFTRSFANGVRRSLTSPKRTISLVFFALYYYFLIMRPLIPQPTTPDFYRFHPAFSLPNRNVLDGVIFAIMAAASLFMLAGVLSYKGGFRPADVDVLFPTPISPKMVLLFRIARDYLVTLILPVLFGVLGYRGARAGLQSLFANYPAHGADMMRMTWLAWMLMALAWVSVGHAMSMFVGRSDLQSDTNRKVITYGIVALNLAIGIAVSWKLHHDLTWNSALEISHWWLLRIALLPATAASAVAIGGIEGDWTTLLLGAGGLLALIAAAFAASISQVNWMYDQAAARGFDSINMRRWRRGGNTYALIAERAKQGKVHRRWLDEQFSILTVNGGQSLVWKEQILQTRGMFGTGVLMFFITLGMLGALAWEVQDSQPEQAGVFLVSIMCALAYFYSVFTGFSGFQEMLKRVDLLKPLPFTSGKILFWELMGKIPIPAATLMLGGLVAAIVAPSESQSAAAGILLSIAMLLEICGAILFTVTLFPDYDDPTQRGLAMIFMLVCIIICSSPGVGVYFLLVLLVKTPPIVAVLPAVAILLAVTAAQTTVAGSIYAGFNPSE